MKRFAVSAIFFAIALSGWTQRAMLEVINPTDDFRHEVVAVSADSVKGRIGNTFRVLEAAGLEVPYQLSYDGLLLIEAAVRPHDTAHFTIVAGTPRQFPVVCHGALHPERKDDFAWENVRGAYRV